MGMGRREERGNDATLRTLVGSQLHWKLQSRVAVKGGVATKRFWVRKGRQAAGDCHMRSLLALVLLPFPETHLHSRRRRRRRRSGPSAVNLGKKKKRASIGRSVGRSFGGAAAVRSRWRDRPLTHSAVCTPPSHPSGPSIKDVCAKWVGKKLPKIFLLHEMRMEVKELQRNPADVIYG